MFDLIKINNDGRGNINIDIKMVNKSIRNIIDGFKNENLYECYLDVLVDLRDDCGFIFKIGNDRYIIMNRYKMFYWDILRVIVNMGCILELDELECDRLNVCVVGSFD
jgi:hypothetical protein